MCLPTNFRSRSVIYTQKNDFKTSVDSLQKVCKAADDAI